MFYRPKSRAPWSPPARMEAGAADVAQPRRLDQQLSVVGVQQLAHPMAEPRDGLRIQPASDCNDGDVGGILFGEFHGRSSIVPWRALALPTGLHGEPHH